MLCCGVAPDLRSCHTLCCDGNCDVHGEVWRGYYAANGYNAWEGAARSGPTGFTAYAPGGGPYEGTHDEIADNWTYYWIHLNEQSESWEACSGSCDITGQGDCTNHSDYWGRF